MGFAGKASTWPQASRLGARAWEVVVMSVVTEHLEQRGAAFEVLPHRRPWH